MHAATKRVFTQSQNALVGDQARIQHAGAKVIDTLESIVQRSFAQAFAQTSYNTFQPLWEFAAESTYIVRVIDVGHYLASSFRPLRLSLEPGKNFRPLGFQ